MNKRALVVSALAAAIAAPSIAAAQKPAPEPPFKAEKCYGIAKAGQNDCASAGNNVCAGTAKVAMELRAWIYVPQGYCNRIQGGTTAPRL